MASLDYIETGQRYDLMTGIKKIASEGTFHINLLHGNLGEDGHIQGVAKYLGLEGSFGSVLPASLAMSKHHMAHCVSSMLPAVKIPDTLIIQDKKYDLCLSQIKNSFLHCDVVIKPNSLGASLFTQKYLVDEQAELAIITNIKNIFKFDRFALVQKFIRGREYSVGCIHLPDSSIALDVVEISTPNGFFGHEEKHQRNKAIEKIIHKDTPITLRLKSIALEIFESVGFEYMCRFDFIVTPESDIYFLEANPIPGLMKNSIFPKMLQARNLSISEIFPLFSQVQRAAQAKETIFDYEID